MDTESIKSSLFTRQQVAQLTGVDDSSLNYWMREGLLRPAEGGSGKGSHRRFDFVQVNIAAIYGQLRRFGVNIAALRSLNDLLQSSAQLGTTAQLHASNYTTAAWYGSKLDAFRRGVPVMIEPNWAIKDDPEGMSTQAKMEWLKQERPATDEQDLSIHLLRNERDYDDVETIVAAAEKFGPGRETEAKVYADLVLDILSPGYSDEITWLLGLRDDGTWDIESGSDGKFFENIYGRKSADFGSGIFVPLGAILRKIWELKTPAVFRRERHAEGVQDLLAIAGLHVKVIPAPDEDGELTVEFDAPVTLEQINEVLSKPAWKVREEAKARQRASK